jgi:hypothetical protein
MAKQKERRGKKKMEEIDTYVYICSSARLYIKCIRIVVHTEIKLSIAAAA